VTANRLERAREAMRGAGLTALLLTHRANIRYLTGLDASVGALLIESRTAILMVDFRYATAARAMAAQTAGLEVHVVQGLADAAVGAIVRTHGGRRVGIEAEHLSVGRFNRLSAAVASAGLPMDARSTPVLVPVERTIERLRAVKDDGEISTLREAGRRLSLVARTAPNWLVPGRTEIEVAAEIDSRLRDAGFERPAFDTIVASGPNGALPHGRPTTRQLAAGEGVVLDFGGVYDGYCVDLTRTLHIGPMPGQFRRLFEAVREARAAAIAAVKPGVAGADIDRRAREVLERHGLGEAFGHGTGHGLGLEVHEEPRISPSAPPDERVVPGMVFTIEPGAYVTGIGGVRIEDDLLVTGDGCELLTDVPIDF
jgi:Xaa-Pro aminopeptidase